MRSFAAGRVVASNDLDWPVATAATGLFGWQDYAVVDGAVIQRRADEADLPLSAALGVLGINGVTAQYGLSQLGQPRAGETVVVDAIRLDLTPACRGINAPTASSTAVGVSTIPSDTPAQKKRVEGLKKRVPERVAPFIVGLCADEAQDVNGQTFGVRNNEICLFSQPRPIRNAHCSAGWTAQSVVDSALPMLRAGFYALDRSGDVFTWDPV